MLFLESASNWFQNHLKFLLLIVSKRTFKIGMKNIFGDFKNIVYCVFEIIKFSFIIDDIKICRDF
jgi:hypothetical protein